MRTTTSTFDSALEQPVISVPARMTIYKSRIFFDEVNSDNVFSHAAPENDLDNPVPEAVGFNSYLGKPVTVSVNAYGFVDLAIEGESPVTLEDASYTGYYTASKKSRPGIWENFLCVFNNSNWRMIEFDPDLLLSGDGNCILADITISSIVEEAAVYPVGNGEFVFLTIDEGSVRPIYQSTDMQLHECPGRFIDPLVPLTIDDDSHLRRLHFGGATKVDGTVFVYYSSHDGSVQVVSYKIGSDGSGGSWSDFFTAIPQDLSSFLIGNVFEHDGRIFMCGHFSRLEEFSSGSAYTLLAWSDDGNTFSLDRRVLVSTLGYRFLAVYGESYDVGAIHFLASGRYHYEGAHYQLIGEDADSYVLDALSVSGSVNSGFSAPLKAGDEEYNDNPYLDTGTFAKLEIGLETSVGKEFIRYHEVVVARISKSYEDGERELSLDVIGDGIWHISSLTHPFYMEIQGKQSVYDKVADLSNLYTVSSGDGERWSLTCDLWSEENVESDGGYAGGTHAGSSTDDFWGPDMTEICTEYPTFGDDATYLIRLFGWSRAGVPDTNPNTADATPTNTPNDDFYGIVRVRYEDGTEEDLVSLIGNLQSTYSNPPQTWFPEGVRAGSYPVEYLIANPGQGVEIIKVGIRVISGSGNTTFYLERVEMPKITCIYIPTYEGGFEVIEHSGQWKLVDTINLQVTTDNAIDGDKTSGIYETNPDYCYAAMIVGDVAYDRDGDEYLQDAQFSASIDPASSSYAPLSWSRKYPPGNAPAHESSVEITAGECPYFGTTEVTWEDSIPETVSVKANHAYIFHIDESSRLDTSEIDHKYVPYFYGSGEVVDAALFLFGSGTISNIQRGLFKVYIFESPTPYSEFKYYGGLLAGDQFELGTSGGANSLVGTPQGEPLDTYQGQFEKTVYGDYHFRFSPVSAPYADLHASAIFHIERTGTNGAAFYIDIDMDNGVIPTSEEVTGLSKTIIVDADYSGSSISPIDISFNMSGGSGRTWTLTATYTILINVGAPANPLVPVPLTYSLTIPATGISEVADSSELANTRKGIPQILLSVRPYTAFNFETVGRFTLQGQYSMGALIGLAENNRNFVYGYIKPGAYGIGVSRNANLVTINEEVNADIEENKIYDVRFWHRQGKFGIEIKRAQDYWPQRGSQYVYEWLYDDGAMAITDDIYHVGVMSYIDPPRFRTTGFRSSMTILPVMPLDIDPQTNTSDFVTEFPASGKIDIEGQKYTYGGWYNHFTPMAQDPLGPFQLRNFGNWTAPFTKEYGGSYTHQGGMAIEFLLFKWWGTSHVLDYADVAVGSSSGYTWDNDTTQWKAYITTGGKIVLLRNRSRHYSFHIPDYYPSTTEKIWLTNSLRDVYPVTAPENEIAHPSGTFVYFDSDDKVTLHGFMAYSGEHDNSIRRLLDKLCKIAGTKASFPGDSVQDAILAEGEGVDL